MIGGSTFYFMNNEEAKYYFYAARSSSTKIPSPGIEEMKSANRKFEADLDTLLTELGRMRKVHNLSEAEFSEVLNHLENQSGIRGLL